MAKNMAQRRMALIACKTLQYEVNKAMRETGCQYPVIWLDSQYHNDPNRLRAKLQEEIDSIEGVDSILLAYGCCGNGTVGLRASTADLIIPRVEDCIAMVLQKQDRVYERQGATFFLTKGWLEGTNSFAAEIEHAVKRYGEERARRIIQQMFKHYKYLMLIDTKAYPLEECLAEAAKLAQDLNLQLELSQGGTWLLESLLEGGLEKDFCFIRKGETVSEQDFGHCGQGLPLQRF
ncbi:DUF1638 domain-containing protein [Desulfosporosinus sp. PR]|uniref:DUF1638 domain-containing protein n=1 Tax=Candidatus Desulfosporosinus nitrosoreducens TaxID=3401928 RepID=UPI0027F5CD39|nr:DUF1638 domain-containing protein [Desulfosporosinus sp. PR]MDQ7092046.1 DUF1638 domain-containing protein [Desulfosporosinus sp. PR]